MWQVYHYYNLTVYDIFDKINVQDLRLIEKYFKNLGAYNSSGGVTRLQMPKIKRSLYHYKEPKICFTFFSD